MQIWSGRLVLQLTVRRTGFDSRGRNLVICNLQIPSHSLCEIRAEKTRDFQMQLLHDFSESDTKSNRLENGVRRYEPPIWASPKKQHYSSRTVLTNKHEIWMAFGKTLLSLVSFGLWSHFLNFPGRCRHRSIFQ